jgi:CRP/FNR family transcriptional regulator, anaerobic regulatory protein
MERLFADLPMRTLSRGQILIYEGDLVQNIFYLADGYVKVSSLQVNGSRRTIFIYTPGDAFPLTSFLSGAGVTRYFYECMTDVELKVMPQKKFQELIKGNLEVGEELIAYTYKLNLQFVDRIEILSAHSARHKVASLLAFLAAKAGTPQAGGKVRLNIPLTSQNIADMCSLTRETSSMQLIKLKKDGIASGSRELSVDMPKLRKLLKS